LNIDFKARATACALAGGLMLGSGVGLVLGGAYWMGERAHASFAHARAVRLAEAAAQGYSERALKAELQTMGPGAVALAQRQDPFVGQLLRGRQDADVISSFDAHGAAEDPSVSVLPASLTTSHWNRGPAAQPFRLAAGRALESTRDLACLTDAVYYEARGEGAAGQAAVAQVVLNRVRHPAFPKSVCGVVFQGAGGDGCQFSFVCNGSMHHAREPDAWRRAEEIAARALDGAVMATIGNATHFHVAGVDPGWGPHLMRVAQVGLHVFYRFGGHGGGPGSFNGQVQHAASGQGEVPAATSADGAPTGQFILASATTMPPAGMASTTPAASAAKPAAAATPHAKDAASEKPESASKPVAEPAPPAHPASVS
jgi:spore germination cell wall hydrolase CwlJ-like protein